MKIINLNEENTKIRIIFVTAINYKPTITWNSTSDLITLIRKIKKSPKRISISDSKWMRDNLHKDLNDYKITFKGFSLEDIVVFLSKH